MQDQLVQKAQTKRVHCFYIVEDFDFIGKGEQLEHT